MTCLICGAEMTTQRENFRYDACGLPNVTLQNVEVSRCPTCGEFEVEIPNIEELHKAIAQALIRRPTSFSPVEIRYLRKYLGWSGADFARHMGVASETVSRWERGKESMGPVAGRLLRLMVATRAPVNDYSLDCLAMITKQQSHTGVRLGLTMDEEGWHAETSDLIAV